MPGMVKTIKIETIFSSISTGQVHPNLARPANLNFHVANGHNYLVFTATFCPFTRENFD